MAALAQQFPSLLVGTAAAFGAPSFGHGWSEERAAALWHEAAARLHASNRPSVQAAHDENEGVEFVAIPLVAVESVRVKFRDVGLLPAMSLQDEVDADE
jgi:hypothetical protein